MKDNFISVIKKAGGFTTSAVIMQTLGIDKKLFDTVKEQLINDGSITVTRGRTGGISLKTSENQIKKPVETHKVSQSSTIEIPKPIKGKIGDPTTIQREFISIGVTVPFDLKKAKDSRTFVLFKEWSTDPDRPSGPWNKVQEICQRHNVVADSVNGILWMTANKK